MSPTRWRSAQTVSVHRHFLVPATAIRKVDELTGEIELVLERGKLRRFL